MKDDAAAIHDHHAFIILRVAGNIAIDLVRKEQRHTVHCVSDETLLAAVADNTPSPEICVIDRDQLRFLALVLAQLPANHPVEIGRPDRIPALLRWPSS